MKNYKILIIEDDDLMQNMLKDILTKEGYKITIASDGIEGWERFQNEYFDLVLSDLKLPKMDGITLLKKVKEISQETPVIIMTAYGTIETAVEAMKIGAYDYITKPFLSEDLVFTIKRALELQKLKKENILFRGELNRRYSLHNIIGKSKSMQSIYHIIQTVAPTKTTVLIQGESGTGKELVAEAIHHLSQRKNKPLVKISCAALPETLLESELFGYEKGAFTDAVKRKLGRFELADGGTIFLDDVDDLPLSVQVKLLRVLQEREFERIGGTETVKVDVRVIAATKTDLKKAVGEGKFREDLYYRLNVVPIFLPPLREKKEDIPLLVKHFLKKFNTELEKNVTILPETMKILITYDWPGNVRELENLVERLVVLASDNKISPKDLPDYFIQKKKKWRATTLKNIVVETEKEHILKVLELTNWKKKEAADILGISTKTLWQKIKEYGIQ